MQYDYEPEHTELKAPWRLIIGMGIIVMYFGAAPLIAFLEYIEPVNPYK